ncbi:NAD(P)-dependent alcohol dehydrogenase [Bradyrhizobium sp. KBS0727]|uniref:NAD(P)-dependent alcohol dehydrogenase n=1 Tax=unclassified Bradyrhizobium TaxID=2631580 RepID=UPI00110D9DF4|nr:MULTISPECIES: NAD(P)-dependent alcohol dehydrogenase [unclassified Bradyrhizobium]QDW40567.1 NAD(P)-dependent alcohol dehydrogenase [Bradyrhizobium sp. KBS0725]QDW47172.1 NAD(P)-dependent alcohol dehydrogenase [Bradyrhizobium sp. KBS0727]
MRISAAIARSIEAPFSIEVCDLAEPQAGEILVKVHSCGVCHTDIAVKRQDIPLSFPRVLGHEGAGVVEKIGAEVTKFSVGDHVLMTFGSCGGCENCHQGHPAYCDQFREINFMGHRSAGSAIRCDDVEMGGNFFAQSSFATHALVTERNIVKVDKDLPLELLAPLGCGIQTGIGTVLTCLKPFPGSSIAVFGAGAVGLAAIMGAKIVGCSTIIAVDIKKGRLCTAQRVGATHVIDGSAPDVLEQLIKLTDKGVHYSMDTTGVPAVVRNAIACLRKRGVMAHVAATRPGTRYDLDPSVALSMGIKIMGVIEGDAVPWSLLPRMINFYRNGTLPLEKLVTTFPFVDINKAIEAMENGAVVKPVLLMPA